MDLISLIVEITWAVIYVPSWLCYLGEVMKYPRINEEFKFRALCLYK